MQGGAWGERQTETGRNRQKETETGRARQRQAQTGTDRHRKAEAGRHRHRQTEAGRRRYRDKERQTETGDREGDGGKYVCFIVRRPEEDIERLVLSLFPLFS